MKFHVGDYAKLTTQCRVNSYTDSNGSQIGQSPTLVFNKGSICLITGVYDIHSVAHGLVVTRFFVNGKVYNFNLRETALMMLTPEELLQYKLES